MYAFIEGKVCEKAGGVLVLEAGGVGYLLQCSMSTLQQAPATGEIMRCHTWLSVREDAMELFGFATREEKAMFLLLNGVSGVGAKTALGLLGAMSLHDLNLAIVMGDINALSRAPGIGKKTAQRIALELKDKVGVADVQGTAQMKPVPGNAAIASDGLAEALEALMALGYSSDEARRGLNAVKDQSDKADELIRLALRAMM